tara:strand:- start:90 stop:617 length:528 start_codon:yes stop_codon:yes gene_type:complete
MEGTSMASPHIAGVVALMLQVNPHLSYQEVLDNLTNNARTDGFTGSVDDLPDNYWGYGKVDAHETVMSVEASLSTNNYITLIPEKISLKQNYPNPFNPVTTINYFLPKDYRVELTIYDIKGNIIETIVDKKLSRGNHTAIWNGKDNYGKIVPSGIYFYTFDSGTFSQTKKMILLK